MNNQLINLHTFPSAYSIDLINHQCWWLIKDKLKYNLKVNDHAFLFLKNQKN